MPEDVGYDNGAQVMSGTLNMDAVSNFFTVNRDQLLSFASGSMTLRIYNTHDWVNAIPLQTIQFTLPTGQAPNPDLVTVGTYSVFFTQPSSINYSHPAVQAVRRWGFNRDGVLGRFTDLGGIIFDPDLLWSMRGRLFRFENILISSEISAVDPRSNTQRVPGALAAVFGYDAQLYPDVGQVSVQNLADDPLKRIEYAGPTFDKPLHFGTDTVRTIVNKNALIPKAVVTEEDWIVHPDYHDETVHLAYGTGFDLPEIVQGPVSKLIETLEPVTLAVSVESTTEVSYQWRRDGRDIPKATSAVLSLYKLKLSDQGIYDVVVTGGDGRAFSEAARLTVNPVLAIVQQPVGGTFQSGDEFKLVVKAVGPGPLGYQWRRNETDIDGATTDQLPLASVSDSTGTYDVIVKDANLKSVTSVKVKVAFSVGPALIVEQPASQVVELGSEVQFAVSATGSNLGYQWRKNGVVIANARDSVLNIADVQKGNEGRYDCVVTNGQMGILSESATLQVGIPLVFLQEPEDQTVALGSTITFEALAEGEEVGYQWFFNDKAIPGAIYNTVTVFEADFAKAGRYSVMATASGKTASAEAHLRIFEPGILIYKLTGTGLTYKGTTSQRVTLSGTLLLDKRGQEPRAAFILTRKEGRLNVFEVQRFGSGFHIATTGSTPKAQIAMTEVMGEESGARAVLWLQGADSLIALSKTASTLAPRTLSGSNQRLDLGPDGETLESVSLKAALDTAGSAISRHLAETLDQTIQRLRTDLLVKGYVEIPEER